MMKLWGLFFMLGILLASCGGQFPYDSSYIDEQELANEYAEGQAELAECESDPCCQDAMNGVPDELSRCKDQQPTKVKSSSRAKPTSTRMPRHEFEILACANSGTVNVREGPGTDRKVVGSLAAGECSKAIDILSNIDWIKIEKGWVSRKVESQKTQVKPQESTEAERDGSIKIDKNPPPGAPVYKHNPTNEAESSKECNIKGNISQTTGEKIYHVPGGKWYDRTNIDPDYGERWFCSEEEARAAGWRRSAE